MSNTRPLTEEEESFTPVYFHNPVFNLEDNLIYATWFNRRIASTNGDFPWTFEDTQEAVSTEDYRIFYPGFHKVTNIDYIQLTGEYHGRLEQEHPELDIQEPQRGRILPRQTSNPRTTQLRRRSRGFADP